MKALQRYSHLPKTLQLVNLPKPKKSKGFCILKVKSVGICGRDLEHHVSILSKDNIPFIPGHEFSGIIEDIELNNLYKIGDRVVSETLYSSCKKCNSCKEGLYNLCRKRKNIGGSADGAFAEFVKVPIKYLHKIPKNISFDCAALIEPACVAYNATHNNSRIKKNDKVLVIGAGTIGLLTIQMLKLIGVQISLLCQKNEIERIKIAKKLQIKDIFYFDDIKLLDKKYEAYFDYVFDAVGGISLSFNKAMEYVKANGNIVKLGWFMDDKSINLDKIIRKSISIKGSFSHNYKIWKKCIDLQTNNFIDLNLLIGKTSELENWKNCFNDLTAKKYVKIILKPNG